jgi:hypothetical protein
LDYVLLLHNVSLRIPLLREKEYLLHRFQVILALPEIFPQSASGQSGNPFLF